MQGTEPKKFQQSQVKNLLQHTHWQEDQEHEYKPTALQIRHLLTQVLCSSVTIGTDKSNGCPLALWSTKLIANLKRTGHGHAFILIRMNQHWIQVIANQDLTTVKTIMVLVNKTQANSHCQYFIILHWVLSFSTFSALGHLMDCGGYSKDSEEYSHSVFEHNNLTLMA